MNTLQVMYEAITSVRSASHSAQITMKEVARECNYRWEGLFPDSPPLCDTPLDDIRVHEGIDFSIKGLTAYPVVVQLVCRPGRFLQGDTHKAGVGFHVYLKIADPLTGVYTTTPSPQGTLAFVLARGVQGIPNEPLNAPHRELAPYLCDYILDQLNDTLFR